jgi:hypothetical protein
MKQQKFIQTSIMGVPFDAIAFPTFPELSSVLWDTVLGGPEKRDPLETYGDAAMHVVVLKILIDRVKEKIPDINRRKRIRKVGCLSFTAPL